MSDIDQGTVNRTISELLKGVESVLDIGCGDGSLVSYLARSGVRRTVGVDRFPRTIEPGIIHPAHGGPIAPCRQGDAHNLEGLESNSFDAVTLVRTLHELSDPVAALTEARRVLKKGGLLLVGDFLKGHPGEKMWGERYYSTEEITSILSRAGFDTLLVRKVPGESFAFILGRTRNSS